MVKSEFICSADKKCVCSSAVETTAGDRDCTAGTHIHAKHLSCHYWGLLHCGQKTQQTELLSVREYFHSKLIVGRNPSLNFCIFILSTACLELLLDPNPSFVFIESGSVNNKQPFVKQECVLCALPCNNIIAQRRLVFGKWRNKRLWLPFLYQVLLFL